MRLVRLDTLLAEEPRQRARVLVERRREVVEVAAQSAGCDPREDVMVHGGEQAQPDVPRRVVADDASSGFGVLGEVLSQPGVHGRAELREMGRLQAEVLRLRLRGAQAASASVSVVRAAFACSATAANAAGSATAMSASDLRSSSIPAL